MNRIGQQGFLDRAHKQYGKDRYDLSGSVYINSSSKVTVRCKICDFVWDSIANNFLRGYGCPKCGEKKAASTRKQTTAWFIQRVLGVYGEGVFDLTKANYVNNVTRVDVVCIEHNLLFSPSPSDFLMRKSGCPECSKSGPKGRPANGYEDFLAQAVRKHGDKYNYTSVGYRTTNSFIDIECKVHGWFDQKASAHLYGHGCPDCAVSGYRTSKPGSIYVLLFEDMTKIGITNRGAKKRSSIISSSSGKSMSVVQEFDFQDGAIPLALETTLLRELRATHTQPTEKFDGSTECFYNVDHEWLLARINELIKEHYGNRPDQYNRST